MGGGPVLLIWFLPSGDHLLSISLQKDESHLCRSKESRALITACCFQHSIHLEVTQSILRVQKVIHFKCISSSGCFVEDCVGLPTWNNRRSRLWLLNLDLDLNLAQNTALVLARSVKEHHKALFCRAQSLETLFFWWVKIFWKSPLDFSCCCRENYSQNLLYGVNRVAESAVGRCQR